MMKIQTSLLVTLSDKISDQQNYSKWPLKVKAYNHWSHKFNKIFMFITTNLKMVFNVIKPIMNVFIL